MTTQTFASLFTGGGLADIGAILAGCRPLWGIEIEPQIAEIAQHNLGHRVHCLNILDADPFKLDRPDILWISPPCPNFSSAKVGAVETELDLSLARKAIDFIRTLTPDTVILENVEGYKRSKSLALIEGALYALGYWIDRQILNAADFGVPQTRRRLILRATRNRFVNPLPQPMKWIGWYKTIEDLIPTLPGSQFAEWQINLLPFDLWESCLVDTGNTSRAATDRTVAAPSPTITATGTTRSGRTKAFVVSDQFGSNGKGLTVRSGDSPVYTVEASKSGAKSGKVFLVEGAANSSGTTVTIRGGHEPSPTVTRSHGGKHAVRAWLERGCVVAMTTRAIARFQTLPDTYELPDRNTLACRIIGNGVPCKLAEAVIRSTFPD